MIETSIVLGSAQNDFSVHQIPMGIAATVESLVEEPVLANPPRRFLGIVIRGLEEAELVTGGEHVWVSLLVGKVGGCEIAIHGCNLYVQVPQLLVAELGKEGAGSILCWLRAVCIVQGG